ncbi:MAG TPA: alpha/beta hydrolase [Candidatus Binatia bacterium]|jgi:esterase/lipase superfamily enzyme|nr:alpha/beta hydrolase [Candidatus Binatia bacterium]
MRIASLLLTLHLLAVGPGAAMAQPAAGRGCEASKLLAVGQYHLCRSRVDAKAARKGTTGDHTRCDAQLAKKFTKAEARADGTCPTTNDRDDIQLAATRHGDEVATRLAGAATTCSPVGLPFAYSYMVTNRATPFATIREDIVPATGDALTFFTATGPYASQNVATAYTEVTQAVFVERLKADLALTASGGGLHLGVYVHGLGNTFSDALTEAAQFGCNLATPGGYPGLVIGYSWPSYDLIDSTFFYGTIAPPPPPLLPQRSGSIRDNVLGSRASFQALLTLLDADVVTGAIAPVALSFLTHSEGNYMLMTGLGAATSSPPIAQCLMLAADVSSVSLQTGEQGAGITDRCGGVTVYYSGADGDLVTSDYEFFAYHRSDYPTRLGLTGPHYIADPTPLAANVTGVDCSKVTVAPAVSSIIDVHSSYRSVPRIVTDLVETMLGMPNLGRAAIAGTTQGFTLTP